METVALCGSVRLILDNECGIPTLVPVKIHRRVSLGLRRRPGNARPEALLTGPRLRQRPVDSEMLGRLRALTVGEDQDGLKEGGCNVPVEQPVLILRKGRRRLHRIIQAQTDEPAEQPVVVQLLHISRCGIRLWTSNCSINCRSLRIVYSVWSRRVRNNFSRRIEGQPKCTYIML